MSIGSSYAYRDYFHGRGRDYYQDKQFEQQPLRAVHNSAAIESTNDRQLTVVFSVPIYSDRPDEVIGVLGMSIALGRFADLRISLPAGEKLLLVETRTYRMLRSSPTEHEEPGEGLVLHHQDVGDSLQRETLPHLTEEIIRFMKSAAATSPEPTQSLLPADYRDPVAGEQGGRLLASFAPVLVSARGDRPKETGWFVIVQQRVVQPAQSVVAGD